MWNNTKAEEGEDKPHFTNYMTKAWSKSNGDYNKNTAVAWVFVGINVSSRKNGFRGIIDSSGWPVLSVANSGVTEEPRAKSDYPIEIANFFPCITVHSSMLSSLIFATHSLRGEVRRIAIDVTNPMFRRQDIHDSSCNSWVNEFINQQNVNHYTQQNAWARRSAQRSPPTKSSSLNDDRHHDIWHSNTRNQRFSRSRDVLRCCQLDY